MGSTWSQIHELTEKLSEKYDCFLLEPIKLNDESQPHLFVNSIYKKPQNLKILGENDYGNDLNLSYALKSELRSLKFLWNYRKEIDVVVTYHIFMGTLIFILAKLLRKKVIFVSVDDLAELSNNNLVKFYIEKFQRFFFKYSDKIICTSLVLLDHARKHNPNSYYLPNGIRLETENLAFDEIEEVKKIGYLGTVGKWVDCESIIKLAKEFSDVHIEVVGSGEMSAYLKMKKEELGLKNLKLYGYLPHKKALSIMEKWDICLIPFKVNRLTDAVSPIKLFEYWSRGKPVISSEIYEMKQFNEELVFYNEKVELFEAVNLLIKNKDLLNKKARLGFQKVRKFDWNKELGDRLYDIINDINLD